MKKGKLGPAFHETLEFLEAVEHFADAPDTVKEKMKLPGLAIEESYFDQSGAFDRGLPQLIGGYANMAGELRSAVKYKMDGETFTKLSEKYGEEIFFLMNNVPIRLPHDPTALILDLPKESFVIVATERTVPEGGYSQMELDEGDKIICLTMMGYMKKGVRYGEGRLKNQKLSHFPLELHLIDGVLAIDQNPTVATVDGLTLKEHGHNLVDHLTTFFNVFIQTFNLTSVLRSKQPGVPASMKLKERRHQKRKKAQHPLFEHTVITTEIDAPEPGQTGYSILQSKKRLHQVRGFWRTYRKTGKRVWVKGHWRGDKDLGVIRRDVELVTHEEEEHVD